MSIVLDGTNGITTPTYGGTDTSEYLVPVTAFKNRIINGAMGIWQRGTSFSSITGSNNALFADRSLFTNAGTGINATITQSSSTPNLSFPFSISYTQASANATNVIEYAWRQKFELNAVRDLAGGTVTVSFWYKSNRTGNHCVRLGTNVGTGVVGAADSSVTFNYPVSGAWQYVSVNQSGFANVTSWGTTADNAFAAFLDIGLCSGSVGITGTISVGDYFQLTGIQLEKGSTATSFDYRPYGTELALCQRYFSMTFSQGTAPASGSGQGGALLVTNGSGTGVGLGLLATWFYPVEMRTGPTVTTYNPSAAGASWFLNTAGTVAAAVSNQGTRGATVYNNATSTSGTNAAIHLTASAEL